MKAFAFQNRLCRDLDVTSVSEITADIRQEILDVINGGLQRMHAKAPFESKTAPISLSVTAPQNITLTVVNGSADISGHTFADVDQYRTIRINGDAIDNQIVGESSLLYPYNGTSGSVAAVIYADAVAIPEPYADLVGDPRIIETNTTLVHRRTDFYGQQRKVARPERYWVESNSRNQNPVTPALVRFDPMPGQAFRMECRAVMAPKRIVFADLVSPGEDIPLRDEEIENYLLPICRGLLTTCRLWRDKDSKSSVLRSSDKAEADYEALTSQTLATPNNRVRTKPGW